MRTKLGEKKEREKIIAFFSHKKRAIIQVVVCGPPHA
jgi:hypothetical protein